MLAKLNPDQKAVALCRRHCIAIACPGSGKSTTLATKAALLLNEGLRVCAVTFTKEAALELRERIIRLADPGCNQRLLVGTFHSVDLLMAFPQKAKSEFGKMILRDSKSPFDKYWEIVKVGVQYAYVHRAIRESGLEINVTEALSLIELGKEMRSLDSFEEQEQILISTYCSLLEQSGTIDFQDIILKTNNALRDKTLSTLPIDFLLVDEFQDTDKAQYEWIEHHARAGVVVTVVGDDDQSIYGFRRALGFEAMDKFARQFDAERILLGTNYRCRSEILAAAEMLINKNTQRIAKRLHADNGPGGTVIWESFKNSSIEASALAEEALVAMEEGAEFAAIAHTNRELIEIQKALVLRNIPFKKADGKSLFDYPEVQVYAALLRSIIYPEPNDIDQVLAWAGMAESDTQLIHKLFGRAVISGSLSDFNNSGISDTGRTLWRSFAKRHSEWVTLNSNGSHALLNIGVFEWLLETICKPNSDHILGIAADLFDPKGKSLEEHMALMRSAELNIKLQETEKKDQNKDKKEVVWLMTAHGSKGLEFDRVWIVGLQHGSFPSDKTSLEEERRLMFVAMTRAREILWVTATNQKKPSVFVYEAGLAEEPKKIAKAANLY